MKKFCVAAILGLFSFFGLGAQLEAQAGKPTLFVQSFTGGRGYDGENIAIMLAGQDLIRDTFVLVSEGENPDYVVRGEIRRDGTGYLANVTVVNVRRNRELLKDRLSYRDSLEVPASLPVLADSVANAVLTFIATPEPVVVVIPPPIEVPVELPPPPVIVIEEPEELPTPVVSYVPRPSKILHLGIWGSYAPLTGETETYSHREYDYAISSSRQLTNEGDVNQGERPPPLGVGVEFDIRPIDRLGFKLGLTYSAMKQEREVKIPNAYGHFKDDFDKYTWDGFGYFAPEHLFHRGRFTLGMFLGSAFSFAEVEYFPPRGGSEKFMEYSVGPYVGAEVEYDVGPGKIFVTCNYVALFGVNDSVPHDPTFDNWNSKGKVKNAMAVNIGLGYRFGMIARKAR